MAVKELSSSPGLTTLYPRAVLGSIAAPARRVPVLKSLVGGDSRELPDTELVLSEVEIDREHLTEYNRICGFPRSDEVPATYPHNIAFPLAMQLMTDRSFPFPVIGMVHIENRITQLRPLRAVEWLTMRVRTDDLRPHDKGTQFDIVAEASVGEEPVWRSRSTYLHREGGSDGGSKKKDESEPPPADDVWDVPGDIGRKFAAVSGDRNPIHMHSVPARLFGQPGAIAHGMWLKGRCLAALEDELADAYTVEARFKVPLKIPARVEFASWPEEEGQGFAVHDEKSGKPHLTGRIEPGDPGSRR
jgi:MaoC dehydratase-like protein